MEPNYPKRRWQLPNRTARRRLHQQRRTGAREGGRLHKHSLLAHMHTSQKYGCYRGIGGEGGGRWAVNEKIVWKSATASPVVASWMLTSPNNAYPSLL